MYKINEDEFIIMMLWKLYAINEQLEQIARINKQLVVSLNQ